MPEDGKGENMSILLVDDDAAVRQILDLVLRLSGLQAAHASCGEEVLVLAEQQPFELIVLDIMPSNIKLRCSMLSACGTGTMKLSRVNFTIPSTTPFSLPRATRQNRLSKR